MIARAILAGALACVAVPVAAHDFYDLECCSAQDCFPVDASAVRYVGGGYYVDGVRNEDGTPHFFSEDDTRLTPIGEGAYHVCTRGGQYPGIAIKPWKGPRECLYVPQAGG